MWTVKHVVDEIIYLSIECIIPKHEKSCTSFTFTLNSQKSFKWNPNSWRLLFPEKVYWGKNLCHCREKRLLWSCQEEKGARAAERDRNLWVTGMTNVYCLVLGLKSNIALKKLDRRWNTDLVKLVHLFLTCLKISNCFKIQQVNHCACAMILNFKLMYWTDCRLGLILKHKQTLKFFSSGEVVEHVITSQQSPVKSSSSQTLYRFILVK